MKHWHKVILSFLLILSAGGLAEAFSMGADSPARTLAKRCREFRDAVQTKDLTQIEAFLSASFKETHKEKLKDPKFFDQSPRLLTRIFINEKYQPKDALLLARAQFRVAPGADGSMICHAFKNGEDQNPELSTARELRMIQEEGQWKLLSWKLHGSW
jgi:hypothetical protein